VTREEMDRRAALKAFVGLGLATGLTDCTSAVQPSVTPSPPELEPEANPTPPEQHEHPAEGDVLVFAFGDREGQVIAPSDVPLGGPQIFAYPGDAGGGHVASESRLDQVMLVRLDPASLTEETASRAVDGIVA
jgi:hypothetical protein